MIRLCVLLVAAVLLAGCGSSGGAPSSTASSSASSAGLPAPIEAVYLRITRRAMPGVDDATLVRFGRAICTDLRSGSPWVAEIAALVHGSHLSGGDAGRFTGASIGAFCPDQESKAP